MFQSKRQLQNRGIWNKGNWPCSPDIWCLGKGHNLLKWSMNNSPIYIQVLDLESLFASEGTSVQLEVKFRGFVCDCVCVCVWFSPVRFWLQDNTWSFWINIPWVLQSVSTVCHLFPSLPFLTSRIPKCSMTACRGFTVIHLYPLTDTQSLKCLLD